MSNAELIILEKYIKYDLLNINPNKQLLKILVSYIKPSFLFKSKILTPIHLGRAVEYENSKDGIQDKASIDWLHTNCDYSDDFEGGISQYNRRVGFFTGTYWAWKNYEKLGNPEYFGSFGYRKLLEPSFIDNLKQYDIITAKKENCLNLTNKTQFIKFHGQHLFNVMLYTFNKYNEKSKQEFEEYLSLIEGYHHEIYIMKKETFFDFANWICILFNSLITNNECYYKKNLTDDITLEDICNRSADYRDIAYVLEVYTGFYLWQKSKILNFKEVELVSFDKLTRKQNQIRLINILRNRVKNTM